MEKVTLVFPLATIAFLLLFFSEYLFLPRFPVIEAPARYRWTRRDSLLISLITVIYAVTAFTGLGNTYGVESFHKFEREGEAVVIELPEGTVLGAIRSYAGLYMGQYDVSLSADGVNWEPNCALPQSHADLFKWRDLEEFEADDSARFLRITATKKLYLGELALYDAEGALIPAAALRVTEGCAALFDEQDMVPERSNYRNSSYFDEIYHARTAYEHIENEPPYEISHPPLGKLILGLGIRLFGMVPFGWRFSGTLAGVLMLPALYVFLKKMFGGQTVPACGSIIFGADFMHFVQTRIATIDSYAVFFTILMYLFFWLYFRAERKKRRDWLWPLALSGLCFGLGAASKWTCLYAGGGLGVLWLYDRIERGIRQCKAGIKWHYIRETAENILWCLLFFVLIPALIYYLSYYAYGTARGMHSPAMFFSREYLDLVIENQKYMFSYHSGVTATHPYSSVWWQWMLDVRPILYYLEYFDDGVRSSFGAFVNPMLCWGGLLAMLVMAFRALFRHDRTARFILIGYLAQLLPWVFVQRVVFAYHYFPSTVFLLLSLGHIFRSLELKSPRGKQFIIAFTAVTALLFIVFFPELAGLPVKASYGHAFLKWFPSWPF